jgi:hypothetical protein
LGPLSQRVVDHLPRGKNINALIRRTWERLLAVRPSKKAWFEAFGLAALNWIENAGCLVACIWAVNGDIPWSGILVAYALAQVSASIPITPGGLGVVEGSLTAVLVAYGMPTDVALASVLLYRAISFWGLVPVGWAVWGYLSFKGRRPAAEPERVRRARRPHPWAIHLHRSSTAVETPPPSAPDIVMPAEPCESCEHEHEDEHDELVTEGSVR